MDADGWKRILTSKQFTESFTDLCTTIANMIKKLCIEKDLVNTSKLSYSIRQESQVATDRCWSGA